MKIQFCGPSGADAVDAAIKLCKTATGRADVVTFVGGFHGSTHGTMAITGLRAPKERLNNLMPGAHFFPYSYCFRCPLGLSRTTCAVNCAGYLEQILGDANGGVRTPAAVILEMVQGEGGVIPAQLEFVQKVRQIASRHAIPMIIDEIQTGCGRTGRFFAFEHYGIEPDVVVLSKGLGGGFPIAIILYDRNLDVWAPGAHTGTFRGNQLAFAAGAEMIKIMNEEKLLDRVALLGQHASHRLASEAGDLPFVGETRGLGLMLGLEIIDPHTRGGDSLLAAKIQAEALQHGLILELGGRDDTVIRLLPALNIADATLDAGLDILIGALRRQVH